jgi:hypothetical protein
MSNIATQYIRNGILAMGVSAALFVGCLGYAGNVLARMPESNPAGEMARACSAAQDDFDSLQLAYANATTAQEEASIEDEMFATIQDWYGLGCADAYGPIGVLNLADGSSTGR